MSSFIMTREFTRHRLLWAFDCKTDTLMANKTTNFNIFIRSVFIDLYVHLYVSGEEPVNKFIFQIFHSRYRLSRQFINARQIKRFFRLCRIKGFISKRSWFQCFFWAENWFVLVFLFLIEGYNNLFSLVLLNYLLVIPNVSEMMQLDYIHVFTLILGHHLDYLFMINYITY